MTRLSPARTVPCPAQPKNPAGSTCGMNCFPVSVLAEAEDPLAVGFRGVHLKGLVAAVAFRVVDDLDMIDVWLSGVNNRAVFVRLAGDTGFIGTEINVNFRYRIAVLIDYMDDIGVGAAFRVSI